LLLNLQEGWWRPFSPGGACPGGSFASPTEITVGTKVATTQLSLGFHEALVVPGAGVLEDQR
jgi:hypothetical protein